MKRRIYVETTVISYYPARPSRDSIVAFHQEATRRLWPSLSVTYESFISALVYQEIQRGNPEQARLRVQCVSAFKMLDVTDDSRTLAERILGDKAIPVEYPEDALHLAIAAVHGMDALITWNFTHLNNPFRRMMIRDSVENNGYACPEICSPEELLEVES